MIGSEKKTWTKSYRRQFLIRSEVITARQDEIFRRKRLSTGANFVHVYLEIWDKGIY